MRWYALFAILSGSVALADGTAINGNLTIDENIGADVFVQRGQVTFSLQWLVNALNGNTTVASPFHLKIKKSQRALQPDQVLIAHVVDLEIEWLGKVTRFPEFVIFERTGDKMVDQKRWEEQTFRPLAYFMAHYGPGVSSSHVTFFNWVKSFLEGIDIQSLGPTDLWVVNRFVGMVAHDLSCGPGIVNGDSMGTAALQLFELVERPKAD